MDLSLVLHSCPHTPKHKHDECQNISIRIAYIKSLLLKWFNHLIATDMTPYTIEICDDPLGLDSETEVCHKKFSKTFGDIYVIIDYMKFIDYFEVSVIGKYDKYTFRIIYDSHGESKWNIQPNNNHDVLIWEPMISVLEAQLE